MGDENRRNTGEKPVLAVRVSAYPDQSSGGSSSVVVHDGNGRYFHATEQVWRLIQKLDGTRTCQDIAQEIAMDADAVEEFVHSRLRPLGLVAETNDVTTRERDGDTRRPDDPFFVRFTLVPESLVRPIAERLAWLFRPGIACGLMVLIIVAHLEAYRAAAGAEVFSSGMETLTTYLFVLASVLVHEFGHAAACRRFGVDHGPIGFGLYLMFPALYTDVRHAWSLPRHQRVIVDAGGVYFQELFTLPLYLVSAFGGHAPAARAIPWIDMLVLVSLNPFLKFDGYWLFSDLLGVPNLRRRAEELLGKPIRRWLGRKAQPAIRVSDLSAVQRTFVWAYAILFAPYVALLVFALGSIGPRLIARYPTFLFEKWHQVSLAFVSRDAAEMARALFAGAFQTLFLLGLVLCCGKAIKILLGGLRLVGHRQP